MMQRQALIDEFLKETLKSHIDTGEKITSTSVYNYLCNYDLLPGEEDISYRRYFPVWIDYFANKGGRNGTPVYETPYQEHFLQFNNYPQGFDEEDHVIKLYLNVDPIVIDKVVRIVHDFIFSQGILQGSKVSEEARSDAIVLRIYQIENAERVINFINNNEFIKDHARYTNPFLITDGIVGVAYDDDLSYNGCVSEAVSEYLNYCLNSRTEPSAEEFASFVEFFINSLFMNSESIDQFISTDIFKKGYNYANKTTHEMLRNYLICYAILRMSANTNSKASVYGLVRDYLKQNPRETTIEFADRIKSKCDRFIAHEKALYEVSDKSTDKDKVDFYHTVKEYVEYMYAGNKKMVQNYPSLIDRKNYIIYALRDFLSTKEPRYITRDLGFRDRFSKLNLNVVKEFQLSAEEIVNGVIAEFEHENNNPANKNKYMDQSVRHPIVEDLNLAYILHGDRGYVDYRRLQAIRNVFSGNSSTQDKCPYPHLSVGLRTLYKLSESQRAQLPYDATCEAYDDEYKEALKSIITRRNVKDFNTTEQIHQSIEFEYQELVKKELMVINPEDVIKFYIKYLIYNGYSTENITYRLIELSSGDYTNVPNYVGLQQSLKRIRPDIFNKIVKRYSQNAYQDYESFVLDFSLELKGDPR